MVAAQPGYLQNDLLSARMYLVEASDQTVDVYIALGDQHPSVAVILVSSEYSYHAPVLTYGAPMPPVRAYGTKAQ
jgi:hypothetical protein